VAAERWHACAPISKFANAEDIPKKKRCCYQASQAAHARAISGLATAEAVPEGVEMLFAREAGRHENPKGFGVDIHHPT